MIEGRDRVGGRVHQKKLPNGRLVDIGANWVHGTADNPILALAKQTNTIVGELDTSSYVFSESGSLYPHAEGEGYAGVMWDIIQDAFRHSESTYTEIPKSDSLLDFFKQKVQEKIPESEIDHEMKRATLLQMSELWGAFIGSPIERQSLKYFWLEECIEGGP